MGFSCLSHRNTKGCPVRHYEMLGSVRTVMTTGCIQALCTTDKNLKTFLWNKLIHAIVFLYRYFVCLDGSKALFSKMYVMSEQNEKSKLSSIHAISLNSSVELWRHRKQLCFQICARLRCVGGSAWPHQASSGLDIKTGYWQKICYQTLYSGEFPCRFSCY